jgi:hypothetical protein
LDTPWRAQEGGNWVSGPAADLPGRWRLDGNSPVKLLLEAFFWPSGWVAARSRAADRGGTARLIRGLNSPLCAGGFRPGSGGRVRFRLTAWVRSTSLADEPGPGKTMIEND